MRKTKSTKDAMLVEYNNNKFVIFKTMSQEYTVSDLPEGIDQVTPNQIKFDSPGQCLYGLYLGRTENESSFDSDKAYSFHEVRLPSGMTVGFCGSMQLDKALSKASPYQHDVHIIFTEEKELKGDKSVKLFQVFTRLHKFPPKIARKDDPEIF